MSCIILFPTQLFEIHYINKLFTEVKANKKFIILWEHEHFFKEFPYHKLKLAFHHATMKCYYDNIKISKLYVESAQDEKSQYQQIKKFISANSITQLMFFNPIEKILLKLLNGKKLIPNLDVEYLLFPSPYFLNSTSIQLNTELDEQLTTKRHDLFYKAQRIKYDIMVKKTNNKITPDGGSWSFDTENRSPFTKTQEEVSLLKVNKSKSQYINSAIEYVNTHYKKNYGTCEKENFIYPISRLDAVKWLDDFIERKLNLFGKYEDALSSKIVFGYHSVLSPLTNIGLITPYEIIEKVKNYKKSIESKEGFMRQVLGWREYCYFTYDKYSETLESSIFYTKANKSIPKKVWEGKTLIPIIDNIIANINKYAYSHHIERLMCIGTFFVLVGIKPKEIYDWFQTMYIDAYDVFMIPNVYGMLLYGMLDEKSHMMTRPYFCSSNYLMKMSDYKSSLITLDNVEYKWDEIFDALYYKLISDYVNKFAKIYSTALAAKRFNSFDQAKKTELIKLANIYIDWLFKNN